MGLTTEKFKQSCYSLLILSSKKYENLKFNLKILIFKVNFSYIISFIQINMCPHPYFNKDDFLGVMPDTIKTT